MAGGGLQEVDPALLESLHTRAMDLGIEARRRFAGDWRRDLDPASRADATIAAANVSTRLMESMTWLLTAQAVSVGERKDPGPAVWRAPASTERQHALLGELAVSVDRLYRRIVEVDGEVR